MSTFCKVETLGYCLGVMLISHSGMNKDLYAKAVCWRCVWPSGVYLGLVATLGCPHPTNIRILIFMYRVIPDSQVCKCDTYFCLFSLISWSHIGKTAWLGFWDSCAILARRQSGSFFHWEAEGLGDNKDKSNFVDADLEGILKGAPGGGSWAPHLL